MSDKTHIIPFSCGTQYADWEERNCCHCVKGVFEPEADGIWRPKCDIQEELSRAAFRDGGVPKGIARRMGYVVNNPPATANFSYSWDCMERVE